MTGYALYQNNSTGFSPYASCNINRQDGCRLDADCTFHSNCVKMPASADEQTDELTEKHIIEIFGIPIELLIANPKQKQKQ